MCCVLLSLLSYNLCFLMNEKSVKFTLEQGKSPFTLTPCVFAKNDKGGTPYLQTKSIALAMSFFIANTIYNHIVEFDNWCAQKLKFSLIIKDKKGRLYSDFSLVVSKSDDGFELWGDVFPCVASLNSMPYELIGLCVYMLRRTCQLHRLFFLSEYEYVFSVKFVKL